MIENITAGFALFATVDNVIAIFFGMIIGVTAGALPGIGVTMAVALALPFTFYMDPIGAILLLTGIYKGAIYGGSISAILISTPGTAAAACTLLDGYPLTKKGEAGRALNMALFSSCFADLISNLCLIFLAGMIASFALRFGPPEFFTLIVFSLVMMAGVGGGSFPKGLLSAAIGFLLATVGVDYVHGTERLSFGSSELMAGVSFVPVLIGLFTLPVMIEYYLAPLKSPDIVNRTPTGGQWRQSWLDFRTSFRSIVRGSFLGVALGAIPGIGAAPASFLSYSEARRKSKDPDSFGKGNIEGVAAAEAGNSGVTGATMIPLLSLGIPGDVITAVMLGAFMYHGLTPGPVLFSNNLPEVYSIFCGILLSSVFLFVVGRSGIGLFARIATIPQKILFPGIMVLCVYGVYMVNNTTFDILVMVLAGILGYFLRSMSIPIAPLLLAFVLGPLFENNLRRSLLLSRGDLEIFFRSYICWFFIALTIIVLTSRIYKIYMMRRRRGVRMGENVGH